MADATSTEDFPGPDLLFLARNIINQIGDLWHERIPSPLWIPVRQDTNDRLDTWVTSLLRGALAETVPRAYYDRVIANAEARHRRAAQDLLEARAERDAYRSDAEAWRRHMAQHASVDNATPPKYLTGGHTGEPPRRPRGGSASYVLTQADARRLGVPLDAQVPRALPLRFHHAADDPEPLLDTLKVGDTVEVITYQPLGPPQPLTAHDKTTALAEDREADPTDDCD